MLNSSKQTETLRNKIVSCSACFISIRYGVNIEEAWSTLKYFGFSEKQKLEDIERIIRRESATLNKLDKAKTKSQKKENVNFWKMVSQVEDALGRQLDIEKITLARWIELTALVKEKSIQKQNGKRKNRRS